MFTLEMHDVDDILTPMPESIRQGSSSQVRNTVHNHVFQTGASAHVLCVLSHSMKRSGSPRCNLELSSRVALQYFLAPLVLFRKEDRSQGTEHHAEMLSEDRIIV